MKRLASSAKPTCRSTRPRQQPYTTPQLAAANGRRPDSSQVGSLNLLLHLPCVAAAAVLLTTSTPAARAGELALWTPQARSSEIACRTMVAHPSSGLTPATALCAPSLTTPTNTTLHQIVELPGGASDAPPLGPGQQEENLAALPTAPVDTARASGSDSPLAELVEPPPSSRPSSHPSACSIARLRRSPAPFAAHVSGRMSFALCGMRVAGGPAPPGA